MKKHRGFLNIFPTWIDFCILFIFISGFILLEWWGLPRQPGFMLLLISLEVIIFISAFFFPSLSLFLTILIIPGITTSSLTLTNLWRINHGVKIGVFGPAAIFPVLAFVFGVWLRTNLKKEEVQPNYLRGILNLFMGLTILSGLITLWRYTNFWPFTGWEIIEHTVNVEKLTTSKARQNVIWMIVNYLTGPLFFLSICQAAWLSICESFEKGLWKKWVLKFIYLPVFIGGLAPICVGMIQVKKDVWYGANKFYIWPWMNRINATFFDPNALGSYILLIIPIIISVIILMYSIRRWFVVIALFIGIVYLSFFSILITHSGSRSSFVGTILFGFIIISTLLFIKIKRIKAGMSQFKYKILKTGILILYFSTIFATVIFIPKLFEEIKKQKKFKRNPLIRRISKMNIKSLNKIYTNIKTDRGAHARIAVEMTKKLPLTGVGLGAYIAELPNYKKYTKEIIYVPDTACNYYLQLSSEQGLITLIVVLIIFITWYYKLWKNIQIDKEYYYWSVIGAGLAAMLVIFLFGTHTLAFEIQCFFWMYLALPFIPYPQELKYKFKTSYVLLFIFMICMAYVCVATTKLSLKAEQKLFKWEDNVSFFSWEKWPDPNVRKVRYSKKESAEEIICNGILFEQKWCALHPDITNNPVEISFQIGDFKTNITATDNNWHDLYIKLSPENFCKTLKYIIKISRTWKASTLKTSDHRRLGLLLCPYKWKKTIGTYNEETWMLDGGPMSGEKYRWTKKNAEILFNPKGRYVKVPIMVSHPDVTSNPVKVTLSIANKNKKTVIFSNNVWKTALLFDKSSNLLNNTVLDIEVSRTMCPTNYGIFDSRELGVAVGKIKSYKRLGFYDKETWNKKFDYRWAGKKASWTIYSSNGLNDVFFMISQPDVTNNPVKITFLIDGKKYITKEVSSPEWQKITLKTKPHFWYNIEAKVNRTWIPRDFGLNDNRILGFAIKFDK